MTKHYSKLILYKIKLSKSGNAIAAQKPGVSINKIELLWLEIHLKLKIKTVLEGKLIGDRFLSIGRSPNYSLII